MNRATTGAPSLTELIEARIRDVADFPEPGVTFKDITPLLADPVAYVRVIGALADLGRQVGPAGVTKVAGIEARGFIVAAAAAFALGVGFVPIRKVGKLPGLTHTVDYKLEYGTAEIEVKHDAFQPGDQVLLLDDVLATGGTLRAAHELIENTGAQVAKAAVVIELTALGGRDVVAGTGMDLTALLPV